jgi:hypothetical protein
MGIVKFPCNIAGRNVFISMETVDTEFCLLFRNNTMTLADGALFWTENKASFLGNIVDVRPS